MILWRNLDLQRWQLMWAWGSRRAWNRRGSRGEGKPMPCCPRKEEGFAREEVWPVQGAGEEDAHVVGRAGGRFPSSLESRGPGTCRAGRWKCLRSERGPGTGGPRTGLSPLRAWGRGP